MANDEINVPSLVLILVVSGLLLRHFFFRGPAPSSAGGATSASRATSRQPSTPQELRRAEALERRTEAAVEQIQQIFPHVDRRQIYWELRRSNFNVAATTERILAGRLDPPPISFQPPARPTQPAAGTSAGSGSSGGAASNAARGGSSTSAVSSATRSTQPNLIQRYHLQERVVTTEAPDAATPPPSSSANETIASGGSSNKPKSWSSNKDERQALLKKRRDDMILEARRKMEAKIAAEKTAAPTRP